MKLGSTRRVARERSQVELARSRAGGDLTEVVWRSIVVSFGWKCAYCGMKTRKPHLDHVVAVSRGGKTSKGNVLPACWWCNSSKGSKEALAWMRSKYLCVESFKARVAEASKSWI